MLFAKNFGRGHKSHLKPRELVSDGRRFNRGISCGGSHESFSASHITLQQPHHWLAFFEVLQNGGHGSHLGIRGGERKPLQKTFHELFIHLDPERGVGFILASGDLFLKLDEKYFLESEAFARRHGVIFVPRLWIQTSAVLRQGSLYFSVIFFGMGSSRS